MIYERNAGTVRINDDLRAGRFASGTGYEFGIYERESRIYEREPFFA